MRMENTTRRFLRLFPLFRRQEAALEGALRALDSEQAFAASLGRHIEALEGRDTVRLEKIEALEALNREQGKKIEALEAGLFEARCAVRDMRERLAGLRPNRKEER